MFAVIDGVEQKLYENRGMGSFVFSPDSKHLAYVVIALISKQWFVVVDGIEGTKYDYLYGEKIVFDSSNRLHYLGRKGNDIYLVEVRI